MKPASLLIPAAALLALAACAPLKWSGHPTRINLSGAQSNPARTLPQEKETAPFINNLPRTAAEHAEAAKLYLDLADKYRKEAASHSAMERLYRGADPVMAAHCVQLSRQLSLLAAQCEEMGKEHEKKAAEPKNQKK